MARSAPIEAWWIRRIGVNPAAILEVDQPRVLHDERATERFEHAHVDRLFESMIGKTVTGQIFTRTIEYDDGVVDGITENRQHGRNKGDIDLIVKVMSENREHTKRDDHVMKGCHHRDDTKLP